MFLSADPLEPVTGAAWAANPYSYAGNDPVGSADPLGLRPVSEEDLRAYQQASNGMLQNAAGAVTGWVSENWEYIAAGAMVVAGFAVMCTGVGGPIGAAMMAGALTSAGGSIWSQKSSNGSVDWGTVLRDGAVGAATGLIGGGASAAAAKATAGMANCLGKNIVSGAVEGAIDGGASNGLQYLTSGQPITVAGFARAVGEGAGEGALGGGASGALSKVTGVSRYGCFTPNTPVLMADGTTKRIDQVEAGEQVLAHDPATGQDVPATVERTFTHENVPTLRVTTTEGTVETTATHPFYVEGRGYTPADQLHEGDVLHTPDGQTVQVVSVQATGHTQTVHNLAIGGLHNYHVATNTGQAILVHNNQDPITGENGACEALGDAADKKPEVPMRESRRDALRSAKRDAGVPMSEQPSSVERVNMTDKFDRNVLDSDGLPISTREYHYTGQGHDPVVIQDHAAGHVFDDGGSVGQHFNVRPPENTRTGKVPGTYSHYPWK
ncbi:HNH/endonuclease VII fold putative polymorphic toxin [Propionibacterium australiense]|uniref:HNH/endonuclease VII fold putative polymorphic toxin n=2 Tax=Propionibacterium australiense TaxID=119981 RepID=UPI000F6B6AFF|nr:HNH/endonuclease VII fold putative polymorphic toxin [Propionibacterium australiense]VEH89193.1 replicative DNA helicase [Propionibacterium australiense]